MGGMQGSMIMGGPDAFDVSSNGALEDLRKSSRATVDGEIADYSVLNKGGEKSVKERYFSPVGKGSLRGSILGMTCAAIGSGVLTFPVVFK